MGLPSGRAITIRDIQDLVNGLVQFAMAIAITVVIGFIVYGGFLMATSGSDAAKFNNGKKTLINALIGLAVVLGLGVIVETIAQFARNPNSIFFW